jgi:hypothetical protein
MPEDFDVTNFLGGLIVLHYGVKFPSLPVDATLIGCSASPYQVILLHRKALNR